DEPVIIAQSTAEAARGLFEGRPLEAVELKGKSEKVSIFAADSVDDDWRRINLKIKKATVPSGGTITYRGQKGRSDLAVTVFLASLAYLMMLLLYHFHPTKFLEWRLYDRLHPVYLSWPGDPRIVLVGID